MGVTRNNLHFMMVGIGIQIALQMENGYYIQNSMMAPQKIKNYGYIIQLQQALINLINILDPNSSRYPAESRTKFNTQYNRLENESISIQD